MATILFAAKILQYESVTVEKDEDILNEILLNDTFDLEKDDDVLKNICL